MTGRAIRDEVVVVDRHPVLDKRVLLVVPMVPEAAPSRIREGIVRRRIAAMTGRCPCGATVDYSDHEAGAAVHLVPRLPTFALLGDAPVGVR